MTCWAWKAPFPPGQAKVGSPFAGDISLGTSARTALLLCQSSRSCPAWGIPTQRALCRQSRVGLWLVTDKLLQSSKK